MDKRTPRESETREATSRKKSWAPPTVLPEPDKKDGWRYRWVRTSTLNNADNTNVSSKFRQGWEPVKAEEHPEITVLRDRKSEFKDNIEVGIVGSQPEYRSATHAIQGFDNDITLFA